MKSNRTILLTLLFLSLLPMSHGYANAAIRFPAVIDNHTVLQQNTDVVLWGWTGAGERITVQSTRQPGKDYSATAAADGKWRMAHGTWHMEYGIWSNYSKGCLFNTAGLPASSFRTDNW